MDLAEVDPKGLVRESYRMDGITGAECRSIFVDWALSLPLGQDQPAAVRALLAVYAPDAPGHPMTEVLTGGLISAEDPARRGGRAGRFAKKDTITDC